MDTRRWILVEAWLALGLSIGWGVQYGSSLDAETFEDEETRQRYWYDGHGRWAVLRQDSRYRPYGDWTVPALGVETLRHELAHYLTATKEQRKLVNFGADDADEDRTVAAEKIIDAMLQASARVAELALRGKGA